MVLIPNGTGDVLYGLWCNWVVRGSNGGIYAGQLTGPIAPGAAEALITGLQEVTLRVNADGSVDIRRTAGAVTYTVNLFLQWL